MQNKPDTDRVMRAHKLSSIRWSDVAAVLSTEVWVLLTIGTILSGVATYASGGGTKYTLGLVAYCYEKALEWRVIERRMPDTGTTTVVVVGRYEADFLQIGDMSVPVSACRLQTRPVQQERTTGRKYFGEMTDEMVPLNALLWVWAGSLGLFFLAFAECATRLNKLVRQVASERIRLEHLSRLRGTQKQEPDYFG